MSSARDRAEMLAAYVSESTRHSAEAFEEKLENGTAWVVRITGERWFDKGGSVSWYQRDGSSIVRFWGGMMDSYGSRYSRMAGKKCKSLMNVNTPRAMDLWIAVCVEPHVPDSIRAYHTPRR